MKIESVSHEPEEIKKSLETKLSLLPDETIKGIGKAVMAFTKWRIDCSETIVLKIKPEPGSKIQVKLPEEAMYTEARSDSISFLYKKQGYLIFYT